MGWSFTQGVGLGGLAQVYYRGRLSEAPEEPKVGANSGRSA
jgi:hypothetical protein